MRRYEGWCEWRGDLPDRLLIRPLVQQDRDLTYWCYDPTDGTVPDVDVAAGEHCPGGEVVQDGVTAWRCRNGVVERPNYVYRRCVNDLHCVGCDDE